jgi:nickel transport protein
MRYLTFLALLMCAWLPIGAIAHDLQHRVDEHAAVSVTFFFANDDRFSFESYEIFRSDEETPFQVGRTDTQGRIVFLPNQAGRWRIKVFSEDGHGAEISLTTDPSGRIQEADKPLLERYPRIIVGVAIIFGVFGLINLFLPRREKK